jgi:histidine ammonia-lyase
LNIYEINGHSLTIADVIRVASDPSIQTRIAAEAVPNIERAANAVQDFIAQGKVAYGITTGFGAFKDRIISPEDLEKLQENILLSHAVGTGPLLDEKTVCAMILIRANTLTQGHSGIRLSTIERMLDLLNHRIIPLIPSKGSLGASGDLAPLAHMSLPLIGRGEVFYRGKRMPSAEALQEAGLSPIRLSAKEGLALTNGTTLMTALGCYAVAAALNLIHTANVAAALTLEAQNGTLRAFDAHIHEHRPQACQIETAAEMRALLEGSNLTRPDDPRNIQDAYTLRCIPQVHGAVHSAILYTQSVINIELNSVTDNPLLFFDHGEPQVVSGGNFHGEPLALALDFLSIALTDLGNMSERRIAKLVDNRSDVNPYPPFLTDRGGLNSGFMILQYTAAALASENKTLSHPASTDSIPSSGNVEDHVSMGANSALHALEVIKNLTTIVAVEMLSACQAVDFRLQKDPQAQLGAGTAKAYRIVREQIPFIPEDTYLKPYLEKIDELVSSEVFAALI